VPKADVRRLGAQLDRLNTAYEQRHRGYETLLGRSRPSACKTGRRPIAAADASTSGIAHTRWNQARTEAKRQVRYLTVGGAPVASAIPPHIRARFENAILTFLIFAGIYPHAIADLLYSERTGNKNDPSHVGNVLIGNDRPADGESPGPCQLESEKPTPR